MRTHRGTIVTPYAYSRPENLGDPQSQRRTRGIKAVGHRASTTRAHAAAICRAWRTALNSFGFGWDKSRSSQVRIATARVVPACSSKFSDIAQCICATQDRIGLLSTQNKKPAPNGTGSISYHKGQTDQTISTTSKSKVRSLPASGWLASSVTSVSVTSATVTGMT